MRTGLYVNNKKEQCGVYEFGKGIGNLLATSAKYKFHYCECDSFDELKNVYRKVKPDIIIYNYHPTTMAWVERKNRFSVPITFRFQAVHVGTIHEVYQQAADEANNSIFDFHIAPDPTLLLKNQLVYKTGRLLPIYPKYSEDNNIIPVIGSFGFATAGKGFEKIIIQVQKEFNEAVIRLNIPFSTFCDNNGARAIKLAQECKELIYKKTIDLQINHDYLEDEELISFLSANSINVFLYDEQDNRGISSATDWALAAGRPVAISKSKLFRHLLTSTPSICVENSNLKSILANGVIPLQPIWREFSAETILWEYERILEDVLKKKNNFFTKKRTILRFYLKKILKKTGFIKDEKPLHHNVWTKINDEYISREEGKPVPGYSPVTLPPDSSLNKILNNNERLIYKPTIEFLCKQFPEFIAKKIPEANVQQAFVLDTTVRLSNSFNKPKILAVGSFEDTAVEALKTLNFQIDDIDPILNYDLGTFITKPNITSASYDIVVSTSVIEHVENDTQFVKDIAYLLKKDGVAILTCDYKDQYKVGDDIPEVDYRFYTQKDIKERLMKAIPDCLLIDEPEWDCEKPDFYLAGRYNYTFASIVFRKIK